MEENIHYVYVYIDPRNFEEFYIGKGLYGRKESHLYDTSDSNKVRRITAIRDEGLEPIVRVIARGLDGDQALLVEKTLIWKMGKQLTNVSGGHFSNKFRPHDSMHKFVSGFDFQQGIYYFNIGDDGGNWRNWDGCREWGFVSAGGGKRYRDAVGRLSPGDVVCAYLSGHGYVGVGRVIEPAVPAMEFTPEIPLASLSDGLAASLDGSTPPRDGEYVCRVEWLATKSPEDGVTHNEFGIRLFSSPIVCVLLDNQQETIGALSSEPAFNLDIRDLLS